jgi:hypothetical protein
MRNTRYSYSKVYSLCIEPKYFDPNDPQSLRTAIAYLRSIPDAKGNFVVAESSVRVGRFKLRAMAALRLDQITGRTPAEVWQLFDADVDRQIESIGKFKSTV